jgi:hypothetical protein
MTNPRLSAEVTGVDETVTMAKRGNGRRNRQRREKKQLNGAAKSRKRTKGQRKKDRKLGWRTSSATGLGTTCVEVARDAERMHVRDSHDRYGPMLSFGVTEWRAFLDVLR